VVSPTVIRALREGSSLAQNEAAEQLGITAGTLAAYEGGHVTPSQERTWQIARRLSLGSPAKGETNPRFLLTYALLGQRFVADGAGHVVCFRDPWRAYEHAERLIAAGFLQVAVVPIWRGSRRSLMKRIGARGEIDGDEMTDPLEALMQYADRLAAEFDDMVRSHAPGAAS
jgi:transcriptional regulator with XRE-family HTH domain